MFKGRDSAGGFQLRSRASRDTVHQLELVLSTQVYHRQVPSITRGEEMKIYFSSSIPTDYIIPYCEHTTTRSASGGILHDLDSLDRTRHFIHCYHSQKGSSLV